MFLSILSFLLTVMWGCTKLTVWHLMLVTNILNWIELICHGTHNFWQHFTSFLFLYLKQTTQWWQSDDDNRVTPLRWPFAAGHVFCKAARNYRQLLITGCIPWWLHFSPSPSGAALLILWALTLQDIPVISSLRGGSFLHVFGFFYFFIFFKTPPRGFATAKMPGKKWW